MKIAVISDIHGNHVALEAVLKAARKSGAEKLFVLGDCVGYYYHPDAVFQMVAEWDSHLIAGNHEQMLRTSMQNPERAREIRHAYGSGIDRAIARLAPEVLREVEDLPATQTVNIEGVHCLLAHGSPRDSGEYVYPDSPEERLQQCAVSPAHFVFIGHTHYPFSYQNNGITVANVGSVGQARDKGGLASWVMLDTKTRVLVFKHTPYDVAPVIAEAAKIDPQLPYLVEVLQR